jgi:hypothetical protein
MDSIEQIKTDSQVRQNLYSAMAEWKRHCDTFSSEIAVHGRFTDNEKKYLEGHLLIQKELFWKVRTYLNNIQP